MDKSLYRMGTDADPQWLHSVNPAQLRAGDTDLPQFVRASASVEASRIAEMLRYGSAVKDGRVIISAWSLRRVALRLAEIARDGLDPIDGGEEGMDERQQATGNGQQGD